MAKITICKYCQSKDVFWEKAPEGKWYLSDMTGGLPHACDQAYDAALARKDEFKKAREDRNVKLKESYYNKKAELDAIPNDSPCHICIGGIVPGLHYNGVSSSRVYCEICDGRGKMTAKAKSRTLYRLRKQLWPQMFNKTKNRSDSSL